MPKDVISRDGDLYRENPREVEGPGWKMSKSKKNVIEPDEILDNYGIDATKFYDIWLSWQRTRMDRWGIQSSKI